MDEGRFTSSRTRTEVIREFLAEQNLQAWLAWRPDEVLMMTGHVAYWGASALLYFKDEQPVLFVPAIEPVDHIPEALEVQEYRWGRLECTDPIGVLVEAIRVNLERKGLKPEQVGASFSAARTALPIQAAEQNPMPEDFWNRVAGLVAKADVRRQDAFVSLYLIKTAEEAKQIQRANQVAGIGLRAFFAGVCAGTSETALVSMTESAIHAQIGNDGIFHARAWATVQSGPHSADAGRFNRSSSRRLENGDLVLIEMATCVNGYWSDLTRTVAVGSLCADLTRVFSVAREAQKAAIEAVRPGATAGEIDAIARETIAQQGLAACYTHGTGHHVGFRYHDPGFGLVPGGKETLQPGMIVTIEPGIYVPEYCGGARIEDNVLVTANGHEVLSKDSRGPAL